MSKTLCILGLATLLATGTAIGAMAAGNESNSGGSGSQTVTGTMTGSPQVSRPATGSAPTATTNQYGQAYPGSVGPTGSRQPDATNPVRSNPSGGGGDNGGSSGSGAGNGGSGGSGGSR